MCSFFTRTDGSGCPAGFTLVEVVVALAIAAVVMGVCAVSLDAAVSYRERSAEEVPAARRLFRFRRVLGEDIGHLMAVGEEEPFRIVRSHVGGTRADRLEFVRVGTLYPVSEPNPAAREEILYGAHRVTYTCRADGEGFSLLRAESVPGEEAGVAVPVLRGLTRFELTGRSDDEGRSGDRVAPDLLEVRLSFGDSDHVLQCCPGVTHRLKADDHDWR